MLMNYFVFIASFQALYGDISNFKVLTAWLTRCLEAMPGFDEIVLQGNEKYKAALKHMMS